MGAIVYACIVSSLIQGAYMNGFCVCVRGGGVGGTFPHEQGSDRQSRIGVCTLSQSAARTTVQRTIYMCASTKVLA